MTMFEAAFDGGSYSAQEAYFEQFLRGTPQEFWPFAPEYGQYGGNMGFFNGAGDLLGNLGNGNFPEDNYERQGFNTTDVLTTAGQVAKLIGRALGNQTDKFNAEAYPLMTQQARASGLPVDCYWFGDMVRVMPDGRYAAIAAANTLAEAEALWTEWAKDSSFFLLRCGGQGTPLLTGCHFDLMGNGNAAAGLYPGAAAGNVTTASAVSFGLTTIIILAIAGFVAWLAWGKNK